MHRLDWTLLWMDDAGLPPGPIDPPSGVAVNKLCIVTWIDSEGSNALNNPLDTTEPWAGATDYNSAGVKNYPSTDIGLSATTTTLYNGYYTHLVSQLKNPISAEDTIAAIYASPWGSKPTEQMLNNVRANWPLFATVYVSGTGVAPPPKPEPTGGNMWLVAVTSSGQGYWKCRTTDGAIYAYGDAQYRNGMNNAGPSGTSVMIPGDFVTGFSGHGNDGYLMVTNGGHDYAFGSVGYKG